MGLDLQWVAQQDVARSEAGDMQLLNGSATACEDKICPTKGRYFPEC